MTDTTDPERAAEDTSAPGSTPTPQPNPEPADPAREPDAKTAGDDGESGADVQAGEADTKREPWFTKRIAALSAKAKEADARAVEAERRAAAALALAQGKTEGADDAATLSEAEVERRAEAKARELAAQTNAEAKARAFNAECNKVFEDGTKAYGSQFEEAVKTLAATGVINPQSTDFLESVLETEAPAKVLHHLGSHPEEAMRISELPPRKQAVELDRLAARIGKETREVSSAPAPVRPLSGTAKPSFDPTQPDGSADYNKKWVQWREDQLAKKRA